jgi:hypothetical protein
MRRLGILIMNMVLGFESLEIKEFSHMIFSTIGEQIRRMIVMTVWT